MQYPSLHTPSLVLFGLAVVPLMTACTAPGPSAESESEAKMSSTGLVFQSPTLNEVDVGETVRFQVTVESPAVDYVEFWADDRWILCDGDDCEATADDGFALDYAFTRAGVRKITAIGFEAGGDVGSGVNVASAELELTVRSDFDGSFQRPTDRAFGCSRGYHPPSDPNHNGIDLLTPTGTPIVASAAGEVVRASYHTDFGNLVIVDHGPFGGSHWYTLYAHLSAFHVDLGDAVMAGALLGDAGSTGRSSGPHLHFEVVRSPSPLPWSASGPTGVAGGAHRVDPAAHMEEVSASCR